MDTAAVAEAIQEVAARIILPRFRALAAHEIEHKGPGDLVTVADRLAEEALTGILTAGDPGVLVVGEEGSHADATGLGLLATAPHAFVVDPVDGTRNFAHGSPDFAVMVAEVRHGITERAWIWQPVHGRLYVVERGAGVTCNARPLAPPVTGGELVGSFYGGRARGGVPGLRRIRPAGCCGIDYPLLLHGERSFLGYRSLHPWDHLPGALMVAELGGRVATVEGRDYAAGVAGRALLVTSSPAVWQRARDALRPSWID